MRTLMTLSTAAAALLTAVPALAQISTDDQASRLPEVTVVATRTATPVNAVPATVSVYTDEDIERLLFTDIKDLVRYEPGVSVVSQPARFGAALGAAGRAGNEGFTIRGLGGDRVLMVVDGVRQPDGFVFGAQSVGRGGYSDLDLMKSVEILRGPASALYGSDGVAGAVSFTTRDPVDFLSPDQNFGARARVGYNSADAGWTGGLAVAGRSGPFSGLIAYTRRDSQETETSGDVGGTGTARTQANPQDIQSNAVLAKLLWHVNASNVLRLTYDHYDMDMTANVLSGIVPAAPPFSPNAVLALTADDETSRDRFGLDWRSEGLFGLDDVMVAGYWQEAGTRQFTFEDRTPAVDRTRDNTFDNRVRGIAATARKTIETGSVSHRLTFGGDGSETRQTGVRDGTVPPFGETFPTSPFPATDYTLAGAFIQDEIVLAGGALRIIPAIRFDAYELSTTSDRLYTGARADQDDNHFSPKVGVVWQATSQFQLFANYAEGFKAPTPGQVNNGFSNLASGYVSAPNPDLAPETSQSFELGARLTHASAMNGVLDAQVVAFQSDFEDFISQQMVGGAFTPANPAIYQFVNFSSVEIEGVEARANLHWDNGVYARAAAAYADGDQTTGTTTASLTTIDPVKVVFGLGYDDTAGRFGVEGIVTWSARKENSDTDGLGCFNPAPSLGCYTGDEFALLDVTAYWNVTDRVTARIGAFNLTDETYGWWSDIRGVAASSAARDAYTQPGRNVGLSLSLRL
ncbi:TonB-dependent hemoglobin/transferrin/lactoferrin family receptor [Brevundimonas sp.]|uniref:TonB-dependent hemoglobin/transferrin/lactoferrin family receptor n=1 Tax=Brevundimonas sp. TaxID=1871086 RepID=UPI00286A6515|nr:TonB-dependent hemoglobin/transferrin/lactoferrin family receptor [Brevundimonas sp.]